MTSLQISVWPEFDKPSTLVIIEGQLAPTVALPADLIVRIPAAAKAPNAVAFSGPNGSLMQATYTTVAAGGDIIIKFTTNSAGFRVEYYDPALMITGPARSYAFRWTSDYAVGAVGLRVQEPSGSSHLSGQPALVPAGSGEYGLQYQTASLGALAAGATVTLDLNYQKADGVLSATAVRASSGSSATPTTASDANNNLALAVGSGVLGLALIAGGSLWYWRGRHAPRRRPARGRRSDRQVAQPRGGTTRVPQSLARAPAPKKAAEAVAPAVQAEPATFCTQCGRRHQPGDRFCRQCGTPVRE